MHQGVVQTRAMFICLICFQEPAWKSVLICTMTCWIGWDGDTSVWRQSLGRLLVATGIAWSSPPWHSLPFLAASFLAPPRNQWPSHSLGSAVAGSLIAALCVYDNAWLPAAIAGTGAILAMWEPGTAAAVITVAWTLAVAAELDVVTPYLSVAAAPMLYWPQELVAAIFTSSTPADKEA